MFNKKILLIILLIILCACNRNIVYEDMKQSFDEEGLLSSNIGIIGNVKIENNILSGDYGSGIIFDKDDVGYYALTSAHVIGKKGNDFLIFTCNTTIIDNKYPNDKEMYQGEVKYISDRDDLAIIYFKSNENLKVIKLANEDPKKDDRILCIGHNDNNWFSLSYGTISSDIEDFGKDTEYPSKAMRHSAKLTYGNSGGAAINEKMELVGITPGAIYSFNGRFFRYGVLIPVSEINICLQDYK